MPDLVKEVVPFCWMIYTAPGVRPVYWTVIEVLLSMPPTVNTEKMLVLGAKVHTQSNKNIPTHCMFTMYS